MYVTAVLPARAVRAACCEPHPRQGCWIQSTWQPPQSTPRTGTGEGAVAAPKTHEIPLKNLHPAPRGTGVIPIIQCTHMWRKKIPCSCRAVSQKTGSAGRAPPDQQREGRPSHKTSNSSFKVASRNSATSIFINKNACGGKESFWENYTL